MKILYVEDELTTNIPKIVRLFKKYLGEENIKKLNELEESEYGASSEEIIEIIDSSNIIKAENNFENALTQVQEYSDLYSFFIIDRNLTNEDYSTEKLKAIDPDYDDKLEKEYFEREGDYLLQKLVYKGVDIGNNFYFLTAYSNSELPNKDEIYQHISRKKFRENNIIDKSSSEAFDFLVQRINNFKILNIQLDNKKYIDILRSKLKGNCVLKFTEVLQNRNDSSLPQIEMNLGMLRKLLEDLLYYIAKNKNAPGECWNEKNKEQIRMGQVIWWICHKKENGDHDYKFGSNSIIKNSLYSIKNIGSDYGSHTNKNIENFPPTKDTVNALIYQLKDLISWVDGI